MITITLILIMITLAARAREDYAAMEAHIYSVMILTNFAPIYGLEWMPDESVPAFRWRMHQKTYVPRPPVTFNEIVDRIRECVGVTEVDVVQCGPVSFDIYVSAEAVDAVWKMVREQFSAITDWKVKPLMGENE